MSEASNAESAPAVAVKRMVRHRRPPMLLVEPIDCEALAQAYRAVNWRWWDGYPTADRIAKIISEGKADLANRPGPRQCCNSGGINIEWFNGEIVVLIDLKLAAEYQKPKRPNNPSSATTGDSDAGRKGKHGTT